MGDFLGIFREISLSQQGLNISLNILINCRLTLVRLVFQWGATGRVTLPIRPLIVNPTLGLGGSARCGGAYDRTRVRTRVDAGAWQGLRRRFKAPSPSFESGATTFFNFGIGTGQAKEQEQPIFFLPFLAKLRPGLV